MAQDNLPEVRPQETAAQPEQHAPPRGRPAVTPDEAWAFAYQSNLSPDDFEEDEEGFDIGEPFSAGRGQRSAMPAHPASPPDDDDFDIGGEFTTSGTDKADWQKKRRASDVQQPIEYLI